MYIYIYICKYIEIHIYIMAHLVVPWTFILKQMVLAERLFGLEA